MGKKKRKKKKPFTIIDDVTDADDQERGVVKTGPEVFELRRQEACIYYWNNVRLVRNRLWRMVYN